MIAFSEVPSLEALRAVYVQSTSSIRTIQYNLDIELIQLKEYPDNFFPPGLDVDPTTFTSVKVFRDGKKVARRKDEKSESGNWKVESWAGFNGHSFGRWRMSTRSPKGEGQLPQGRIGSIPPDELKEISVATLTGTYVFPNETLERMLRLPGTRILGVDKVDGAKCVKVEFPQYTGYLKSPDYKLQIIAWFDPAHGYLPRRIKTVDPNHSVPLPKWTYEVQKFQQVSQNGEEFWIPLRATMTDGPGYNERRIRFSNVVINKAIPDKEFSPVFPFGTLVRDIRTPGESKTKITGEIDGEKHYIALKKAIIPRSKRLSATASSLNYSASSRSWKDIGIWALQATVALLLLVGITIAVKKKFA